MQSKSLFYLLTGVLLVLLGVLASGYWTPARPTVNELMQTALHGDTIELRTAAAVKLANYGPEAVTSLRSVLEQSNEPHVRSVCVAGLASLWDYQSIELFLDLAETGHPRVCSRAAQAVMRMTGRQRRFSAQAPVAERRNLVQHMRDDWAEISDASQADRDELIRRLKASHETN